MLLPSSRFASICLVLVLGAAVQAGRAQDVALLVGAPSCQDARWPSLRYAEQDISRLGELLAKSGYSAQRLTLLTPAAARQAPELAPSRQNLLRHLQRSARMAGPEDTLLIVLSGHGIETLVDGEQQPSFCPLDGSPSKRSSLLLLSDLVKAAEANCRARNIVLIADACRSWTEDRPTALPAAQAPKPDAVYEPPARWRVYWSCSPGEASHEDPRLQHGVFMHFLIEALRGSADSDDNGRLTDEELAAFVSDRTRGYIQQRLEKPQTPQFLGGKRAPVEIAALPPP